MKTKVADEKENPVMGRKELRVEIEHGREPTPSRAQLQALLSKELKKEPGYIDIRNIFSSTGMPFSSSKVFVWSEKKVDDLSIKKEPKKEGDAKEEKKEEPKAEKKEPPKKEEARKEEKPKPAEEKK